MSVLRRADFIVSAFPWLFVNSFHVSTGDATEQIDDSVSQVQVPYEEVHTTAAIVARPGDKINGISTPSLYQLKMA